MKLLLLGSQLEEGVMADRLNSTKARQGSKGTPVLIILIVALILIIGGYFVIGAVGYSTQPESSVGDTSAVSPAAPAESSSSEGAEVSPSDGSAGGSPALEVPGGQPANQ